MPFNLLPLPDILLPSLILLPPISIHFPPYVQSILIQGLYKLEDIAVEAITAFASDGDFNSLFMTTSVVAPCLFFSFAYYHLVRTF